MEAAPLAWASRSVLVTGCTGFLGGAITRELIQRGAKVVGLVRQRDGASPYAHDIAAGRFHVVNGRVEDSARLHAAMAVHEISAIFHFARSDAGFQALLQAASVYHPRTPVVTAKPTRPLRIAISENHSSVPVGVARFGELFGPRLRDLSQIIPRSILSLLRDETIQPTHAGARDFVYIHDAVRACLLLAEEMGLKKECLDLTFQSGWVFSDTVMSSLVATALAGNSCDASALRPNNPMGWKPHFSLTAALDETIQWCKQLTLSNRRHENDSLSRAA